MFVPKDAAAVTLAEPDNTKKRKKQINIKRHTSSKNIIEHRQKLLKLQNNASSNVPRRFPFFVKWKTMR